MNRGGWVVFNPYRLYHSNTISHRYAADFFSRAVPPCEMLAVLADHRDGREALWWRRRMVCHRPSITGPSKWFMIVKVGSGSSGDTFELKGAEWAAMTQRRARPASVQSMLPSLRLERLHNPRHRI